MPFAYTLDEIDSLRNEIVTEMKVTEYEYHYPFAHFHIEQKLRSAMKAGRYPKSVVKCKCGAYEQLLQSVSRTYNWQNGHTTWLCKETSATQAMQPEKKKIHHYACACGAYLSISGKKEVIPFYPPGHGEKICVQGEIG